jgi:hypothetical protein
VSPQFAGIERRDSGPGVKRFGLWLRRNKDRVISKHKIQANTDNHSKQQVWWLATL